MPELQINNTSIFYEDTGGDKPVILFAHGLLFSSQMFEFQIERLHEEYRCISFDFRGQGLSDSPKEGYDMDTLMNDTVELIRKIEIAPVHFTGHSLGGYIGILIAAQYPELIKSLTLLSTTAEPESDEEYKRMRNISTVGRLFGYTLVTGKIMRKIFGPAFREDPDLYEEQMIWKNRLLSNNRKGIRRAVNGAINRDDISEYLHRIQCPTLILVGDDDAITPPAHSEKIKEKIPNATLKYIPRAGHMLSAEAPDEIADCMIEHLEKIEKQSS